MCTRDGTTLGYSSTDEEDKQRFKIWRESQKVRRSCLGVFGRDGQKLKASLRFTEVAAMLESYKCPAKYITAGQ